jgi:4a-hydroxytetrahydrobiopterin dehydratase
MEGWAEIDGHHLERSFTFPDFATALAFVNRVGEIADAMDHHPEVLLAWGKVTLRIWTHTIDGLTELDREFAARVNEITDGGGQA